MEFIKLLEDKKTELEDLRTKLSKFENEFEGIKEKFPPRWSGSVKELNKFVMDVEEWIKSPKVKRTKELIDKLKKYANDGRSFKGLGEDYLISILDYLENVDALLSEMENKSLKASASMKILDKLQEEEDFKDLIQDIRNYWQSFKEFEEKEIQNEFLEVVKEDRLTSLTAPVDFSLERITEAKSALEKASNAFELLVGSGVSIQAYIKTYKASKSADEIWEKADTIRELLRNTDFKITERVEDPFGKMTDILDLRAQYVRKEDLTEIIDGLKEIEKKIGEWKKEVEKKFEDEYHKTKALTEFAKFEDGKEGLLDEFRKKLDESFNVHDIYNPYEKLQEIKREATKKLEGQFSEDERKIIENLETADELVESMGKNFWVALKSLREKQLIKIGIKRGV